MITKLSFILTLGDGRQFTFWRGDDLIPPDAIEIAAGPDYAIFSTGAGALLVTYSYGEDQATPSIAVECSSVAEAEELMRTLKANEGAHGN